jgi:hypothetical protein
MRESSDSRTMPEPTPQWIAAAPTVSDRLLLFCLPPTPPGRRPASRTPRRSNMMVRGLIERQAASRFALTEQERAVLAAMPERR